MLAVRSLVLLGASLLCGAQAAAADFTKPIRLVVGVPAGGSTDILARLVAPHLSNDLGQPVIVENRPGANTTLAARFVENAPADGSAFLVTTEIPFLPSEPGAYVPSPESFVAVGKMAPLPWVYSVSSAMGAKTMPEYLEAIQRSSNARFYAAPTLIGLPPAIGNSVGLKGGVEMRTVPYAGGALVMNALLGGHVPAGVTGVAEARVSFLSGKTQVLAVSGSQRSPFLPEVPTFEEAEVPGLQVDSLYAVLAHKDMEPELVARMNIALNAALRQPSVEKTAKEMAVYLTPASPEETARELKAILSFWLAKP